MSDNERYTMCSSSAHTDTSSSEQEGTQETWSTENSSSGDELNVLLDFEPYQDEPLGRSSEEEEVDNEADEDGLTPAILAARYEGTVPVHSW